jgi:hypothetical protein
MLATMILGECAKKVSERGHGWSVKVSELANIFLRPSMKHNFTYFGSTYGKGFHILDKVKFIQ